MKVAIGYAYSSAESCQIITEYAAKLGYDLVGIEVDEPDNPRHGLGRAVALIKEGAANALIAAQLKDVAVSARGFFYLLETLFQSPEQELHLIRERFSSSSVQGLAMRPLLHSIAEYAPPLQTEIPSGPIAHKRIDGEHKGGTLQFGYALAEDGRTLLRHDGEQSMIDYLIVVRNAGLSWTKCAEEMNRKFPLKSRGARKQSGGGGVWHRTTVQRIYARESQTGQHEPK